MKIVLGTTLWQRPEIEELTLSLYAAYAKEAQVDVELVAVGSEGPASRLRAERAGWHYEESLNRPLGRKHNTLLEAARSLDPDVFVLVGSDDWLSEGCFDVYGAIAEKHRLFTLTAVYFVDAATGRAKRHRSPRIGAGRAFRRDVLQKMDWTLWPDDKSLGLDEISRRRLARNGFARWCRRPNGIVATDFKTETNLWKFDRYRAAPVPLEAVLAFYPASMVSRLQEAFPALRLHCK